MESPLEYDRLTDQTVQIICAIPCLSVAPHCLYDPHPFTMGTTCIHFYRKYVIHWAQRYWYINP